MLNNIFKYLSEILKDVDNAYSSKRLVVIMAMLSVTIAFFCNLFYNLSVEQFMYDGMMYIIIAGLGIVGAEKFRPVANKANQQ